MLGEMCNFDYDKPKPSLCDSCEHAGKAAGGSVSIGSKTYAQRYCRRDGVIDAGDSAIHYGGKQSCKYYTKKVGNLNVK